MEQVNDGSCETWRELIAMQVFGDLTADERTALNAHLEGCATCRDASRELTETAAMLQFVDPAAVEPTARVSAELSARVLGDLRRAGEREHRRRRTSVVSLCLSAAAAVVLVLALVLAGGGSVPQSRTLALKGSSKVTASAVLVSEPWGTSLTLNEKGLPSGVVYTVSMKTKKGAWWTAGTYRPMSGAQVKATMSCAVSLSHITGLRVENAVGDTVLTSFSSNTATYN
ncbi:MAG TPA: zf-HC2 domain-containing protein [Acidimicrobiales bacterium]|jgi:predicted anti-sigma-YlaC factor YlaD|nr:zf-HC2 domain-containing protein [Acidimicrobiales bacterium]